MTYELKPSSTSLLEHADTIVTRRRDKYPWYTIRKGESFYVDKQLVKAASVRMMVYQKGRKFDKKFAVFEHEKEFEVGCIEENYNHNTGQIMPVKSSEHINNNVGKQEEPASTNVKLIDGPKTAGWESMLMLTASFAPEDIADPAKLEDVGVRKAYSEHIQKRYDFSEMFANQVVNCIWLGWTKEIGLEEKKQKEAANASQD